MAGGKQPATLQRLRRSFCGLGCAVKACQGLILGFPANGAASQRENSGHSGRCYCTHPFGPTPSGCRAPPRGAQPPVALGALSAGATLRTPAAACSTCCSLARASFHSAATPQRLRRYRSERECTPAPLTRQTAEIAPCLRLYSSSPSSSSSPLSSFCQQQPQTMRCCFPGFHCRALLPSYG